LALPAVAILDELGDRLAGRIGVAPPRLVVALVEAGTERVAAAGQDDHAHRRIDIGLVEGAVQLVFEIGRQRVHARRRVERDGGDAVSDAVEQILIVHGPSAGRAPGTVTAFLGWIASFTFSRTSAGVSITLRTSSASSPPVCGRISSRCLLASATKAGSASVRSNALRSAAPRSPGTPGVVATGRPTATANDIKSSTCFSCGLRARSRSSGTFGNSGSFSSPTCTSGTISLPST